MQVWGLTGGIASGKSSVARRIASLGIAVVDADALYHGLIAAEAGGPSPLARAIGDAFEGVLGADGVLDRRRLGKLVFADAAAKARLEAIAHPAVAAAASAAFEQAKQAGHAVAVYDVPLLYEQQLQQRFVNVVVVWVSPEQQLIRLQQRDGLSLDDARARVAAQMPLDDKRALAQVVIDNSGPWERTAKQVDALVRRWQAAEYEKA